MGADNQIKYKLKILISRVYPHIEKGYQIIIRVYGLKITYCNHQYTNSDVVINGLNGFKVKAKSSIDLSNALKKLIYNKKIRLDMGFESLNLCEKIFNLKYI